MLSCSKVLPLRHNGGIGFEVKVRLVFFCISPVKHIYQNIKQNRVKSRVLIFGKHRYKTKVYGFGLFKYFKEFYKRGES